jgi:hypothetical protein
MYKPPNENWPTLEQVHSDPDYGKLEGGMLGFKLSIKRKINPGDHIRSWNYSFIFHIELLRINPYLMSIPGIKRIFGNFHEVLQKYPVLKEYRECVIRELDPDYYVKLRKITKIKWKILKASTKLLSLHQRAVVTANNPERMFARGEFEI